MLARYPVKPKQFRKAQTLASKNLDKVYGKIRKQFTKNVYKDTGIGPLTPNQRVEGPVRAGTLSGANYF